jgi:hypothetical protein
LKARLRRDGGVDVEDVPGEFPVFAASIHAAGRGELYETDLKGNIYRIEAQ